VEVSKALAQPAGQVRLMSLRAAVQAWAATDPRAALAWVQNFTKDFEQWQLTNAILGAWTVHEPVAAATYALGLPQEKRRSWESLRQVVMFWSRNEPRAALAWVQNLQPGSERNDLVNVTVGSWAQREPEAASAFARGYPPGRDRTVLLSIVLDAWTNQDPAAAWTFANTLPPDTFQPSMMQELLGHWGARDPVAALSHVNELSDSSNRPFMQDMLVGQLAAKDLSEGLAYARKLTGAPRDSALYQIAKTLADHDLKTATTVSAEISPGVWQKYAGEMLADAQGKIAIAAAAKNPGEAIKLISQIPKGRQRSNAILFVALEIAKHDPRAAMALADAYPEADESEGVRANALPVWAMNDFDAAVTWARQLSLGVSRDRIASRLADQWAERNPSEAFVFMQTLADSNSRNDFQRRLCPRSPHFTSKIRWIAHDLSVNRSNNVARLDSTLLRNRIGVH